MASHYIGFCLNINVSLAYSTRAPKFMMNSGLVQVLQFLTSNKLSWEEEKDGVPSHNLRTGIYSQGRQN